ncbi:uncharacterized protein LOC117895446 [Drosophila subobscura]|uniref:uncharacterized protein LOC117895446 n=1 Tax=Drosophila subobscura TaxID=7241 RepID=UPI00155ACBD4|nr:uncharacterized protein LOC117895446 [Drosophila subobscura]
MREEILPAHRDYLLMVCYAINAFELFHSLYFLVDTAGLLITYTNLYTSLAFLGTIVWFLTVVALSVGLWQGRPMLFIFWLFFSGIGTLTDIVYLVWSVTSSLTFDWLHFLNWTVLYFGIVVECTCLYLVYSYYRRLSHLYQLHHHEQGDAPSHRIFTPELRSETSAYPATDTKSDGGKDGRNKY